MLDDEDYWEPYLDVLQQWYSICEGVVDDATNSWSGMVEGIEVWQEVAENSSHSLSYVLSKIWKFKYDAIRMLWNQEVDSMTEWMMFNKMTTSELSLLEDFNPEGRDYNGETLGSSFFADYPSLSTIKKVLDPWWLPSEEPYVFDLYRAESYKPPASAVANAKKGLRQRKEWGRGGLSPSEAKSQGIDSGVTRARKIASGKVSKHDVRRMSAFNRHRKNNRPEKKMPDGGPTAGTIAWNLWGGTSGVNWAKKKSATMNAETISGDPWDEGSVADEVYKLLQTHGKIDYWSYRKDDEGYLHFDIILDPLQTELGDFAAESLDYNSFTNDMEDLLFKYSQMVMHYDTEYQSKARGGDGVMKVSVSFIPFDAYFDDVDFDAEAVEELPRGGDDSYEKELWVGNDSSQATAAALNYLQSKYPDEYNDIKYTLHGSSDYNKVWLLYSFVTEEDNSTLSAEEISGDRDIEVGDVVRSYDFVLGGKIRHDDCYVEGMVVKIAPVEWCAPFCDHYHIKTIRRMFNGKPTTHEDYYFPVADPSQTAVRRIPRWSAESSEPVEDEDILAKALSRARMRSLKGTKPLKIEKLPHRDQKTLKDFEAVVIPKTSGYGERAAANYMAIEASKQQEMLLEVQTLLKLKVITPEEAFAMVLGE